MVDGKQWVTHGVFLDFKGEGANRRRGLAGNIEQCV